MRTFIILLRGVTPTGRNKVPMAPLRAALAKAGLQGVRTYIQSGNVIAESDLPHLGIEKLVHDVIRNTFGGNIAVLSRTPQQFANILKRNPFGNKDGARLCFSMLAVEPDKKLLQQFLTADFAPDRVQYANKTIYTLYATKHSDSKFNNNFFERKLRVTATTRNRNTMLKLVSLTSVQPRDPLMPLTISASNEKRTGTGA